MNDKTHARVLIFYHHSTVLCPITLFYPLFYCFPRRGHTYLHYQVLTRLKQEERWLRLRQQFHRLLGHTVDFGLEDSSVTQPLSTSTPTTTTTSTSTSTTTPR